MAEKLDYTPGVFTVERHVRGKWVCTTCETLVQAPVPAHIIDKGIPTTGLLAQVLVSLARHRGCACAASDHWQLDLPFKRINSTSAKDWVQSLDCSICLLQTSR